MDKIALLSHLKREGFSEKIIKSFEKVQRENFVPLQFNLEAYEDTALPLEEGATISQPSTIALMLELLELKPKQKILEIGSGCGYVLALLAELSPKSEIHGVEISPTLTRKSISSLKNYPNIKVTNQNGFAGLPKSAPFDRILVSASSEKIPEHLYPQLKKFGIVVSPVRKSILQIKKQNNKILVDEFKGFAFVPLIKNRFN